MKPIKLTNNTNNHDEDETLIQFLRTYQPSIPLNKVDSTEKIVMETIIAEKQNCQPPKHQYYWVLPSTIIATLLLFSVHNSIKEKFQPQIAEEASELEAFMINSWNGSMVTDEHRNFEPYFVTFDGEF